ncbi:dihydrofolate reductase family protein [Herbiconiux moechotypicola]|uniref:Dihydrofolate reductase family protein n=1 Tax=Herbiconiux moechotypicola TaxID=637393 RepID=A0ABP5R3T2_9MICO|nr:dihydrofolate reductase family protein [Herbiconiux moechotypicola]MCS5731809.1 dihydrofolate reductase family protein [Herbiconiux moechotypicola]
MTGRIEIDLFTTLDGVSQAPGGPDEDRDGGFAFGGWQAPFDDDEIGADVMAGIGRLDALLLGRKTYDIFASYWPHHLDGPEGEIGRTFDEVPKYVASRHRPELTWRGARLLDDDPGSGGSGRTSVLAGQVAALRERHREVHVIGSIDFARSLVADNLFDRLTLWVFPIVLGAGKRLFPDDGPANRLTLLEPAVSTPAGILILRYGPTGETPATGDMTR